jgi:predicted ATP-grasp superfamily ATP-dependent carboligase
MCEALAADFAAIDGVEVACLRDARMANWQPPCHRLLDVRSAEERDAAFKRGTTEADWTVVIAPEIKGVLLEFSRRVLSLGGRLLGGSLPFMQLASDKHATAEHLAHAGIPVPRGIPFQLGQAWPEDFSYPAVWKPRDGAGSQGIRRIEHCHEPIPQTDARPGRLEALCPGTPRPIFGMAASVAFLCGPGDRVSLPSCKQYLAEDFAYLGGSLPVPPALAERATRLTRRAVASLPEPLGYLGVDIVLGAAPNGDDDVVIEINPRLTTSYIALRAACHQNLAEAMLVIAAGGAYNLSFNDSLIEFRADGTLEG